MSKVIYSAVIYNIHNRKILQGQECFNPPEESPFGEPDEDEGYVCIPHPLPLGDIGKWRLNKELAAFENDPTYVKAKKK